MVIGQKEYYKRKDKPFEEGKNYEEVYKMFPKKIVKQNTIKTIQRMNTVKNNETYKKQDSSNIDSRNLKNASTLITENFLLSNRNNH